MGSLRLPRIAGLLYLVVVVAGLVVLKVVPDQIIVAGDAAATANNLRASETLFRVATLVDLLAEVLFLIVVLALYRIFKGVHESLAAVMVVLVVISLPMILIAVSFEIAAVSLVGSTDLGPAFGRPQVDALASLLLALHNKALLVDEMLWGLWLFPLGALQLRSGFVPRVVGVLAIVAGAGYVLDFAISLVVPDAANSLASVVSLAQAGELATVVWLLATRGDTRRADAHRVVAVAG